jgi:hypothetical protein
MAAVPLPAEAEDEPADEVWQRVRVRWRHLLPPTAPVAGEEGAQVGLAGARRPYVTLTYAQVRAGGAEEVAERARTH